MFISFLPINYWWFSSVYNWCVVRIVFSFSTVFFHSLSHALILKQVTGTVPWFYMMNTIKSYGPTSKWGFFVIVTLIDFSALQFFSSIDFLVHWILKFPCAHQFYLRNWLYCVPVMKMVCMLSTLSFFCLKFESTHPLMMSAEWNRIFSLLVFSITLFIYVSLFFGVYRTKM